MREIPDEQNTKNSIVSSQRDDHHIAETRGIKRLVHAATISLNATCYEGFSCRRDQISNLVERAQGQLTQIKGHSFRQSIMGLKQQTLRVLIAEQHYTCIQVHTLHNVLHDQIKVLIGIRHGAQELCERIDNFQAARVLLQESKVPGILDGCCRVGCKRQHWQHVVDQPVVAGAFGREEETNHSTGRYQRQQEQRTDI